jgi:hypothetical protein
LKIENVVRRSIPFSIFNYPLSIKQMRTQEEILAEMDAIQASRPELAGLANVNSSTSEVSFFKLLKNMWVLLVQLMESAWETFRADVEAQIALTRVGTLEWYADQMRVFQFGVPRIVQNGKLTYEKVDAAKQIVKQVCVVEDPVTGRLLIKVVKAGGVPLSASELAALQRYTAQVKYAGVTVDAISLAADELKLVATCQVDRQLIGLDGIALSGVTYPVFDAIAAYARKLPIDSILNNTAITDTVQALPGVKDFVITESYTRRPGTSQWLPYTREVVSTAGHLALHPDTVITYVG